MSTEFNTHELLIKNIVSTDQMTWNGLWKIIINFWKDKVQAGY